MNKKITDFLEILKERDLIHQTTDMKLLSMENIRIVGYTGFDCTADSLHVGSLLQLMMLRWLQKTDNKPIVLIGGGTTKIGDPSGKDETRKILNETTITENSIGIKNIIKNFIKFGESSSDAILLDNSEWLNELKYIDFLRDIGCHFSINRMLTFDSVKTRLDRQQNLSFLEFNYMINQAYDYFILNQRYNCNVQFGGSDQWGNIVNGIDLIKRLSFKNNYKVNAHAITSPLITTANGNKMGKTSKGTIWLSENKLSIFDFWQFWRNTLDEDVIRFLKFFTEIDLSEIQKLSKLEGEEINEAKLLLANSVTEVVYGKENALKVQNSIKEFAKNEWNEKLLPSTNIEKDLIRKGLPAYKVFSLNEILCKSNSEARRLIKQGGAKINGNIITDFNKLIDETYVKENNSLYLSAGAKRRALIKITS